MAGCEGMSCMLTRMPLIWPTGTSSTQLMSRSGGGVVTPPSAHALGSSPSSSLSPLSVRRLAGRVALAGAEAGRMAAALCLMRSFAAFWM